MFRDNLRGSIEINDVIVYKNIISPILLITNLYNFAKIKLKFKTYENHIFIIIHHYI
jgi:hypothetical protein